MWGIAVAVIPFLTVCAAAQAGGATIQVDPPEVAAGLFFGGATVHVAAMVPSEAEVAVVCAGEANSVELKKKGKVGGILWMNVGEVSFERVPAVYLLATSVSLDALAPAEVLQELGVGYGALESRAGSSVSGEEGRQLFRELVKLKESEGLFSFREGAIELSSAEGGELAFSGSEKYENRGRSPQPYESRRNRERRISASCHLPARTAPGEYEVRLYGFANHRGELLATERFAMVQMGTAHLLSSIAHEWGFLYGVVAVLVALAAGLLSGLVFGRRAKESH